MFFTFNFSSLSIPFSKYPKAEGSPLKFFLKKGQFPDFFSPAGYAPPREEPTFFRRSSETEKFHCRK